MAESKLRWLLLPVLVLLPLAGAALWKLRPPPARAVSAEASPPSAAKAKKPAGPRAPVLVIAADGLDLDLLQSLTAAGKLPTFKALLHEGAHGVLLSERIIRSPALWTTVATGRPRQVHGIYDFVTSSGLWPAATRTSEPELATSEMRRVPALWDLATAANQKVAVVGWLNTWPAEEVNGLMVSPVVAVGERKQFTIKGGVYPDEKDQVWPASRWDEVKPLITTPDDLDPALVRRFAPASAEKLEQKLPIIGRYLAGLRWSLAHTVTMRDVAVHSLKTDRADLTMVYFEGADSLGHRFWAFRQGQAAIRDRLELAGLNTRYAPALESAFKGTVTGYYELLDDAIGQLLRARTPGRVLVVSDHGFGDRTGRYEANPAVPFTGEHRLEGTIIAAGQGIVPGRKIYGATLYDVAPTVAEWLGVTIADAEGHSLHAQLTHAAAGQSRKRSLSAKNEKNYRARELDRLRSLGYVQ